MLTEHSSSLFRDSIIIQKQYLTINDYYNFHIILHWKTVRMLEIFEVILLQTKCIQVSKVRYCAAIEFVYFDVPEELHLLSIINVSIHDLTLEFIVYKRSSQSLVILRIFFSSIREVISILSYVVHFF